MFSSRIKQFMVGLFIFILALFIVSGCSNNKGTATNEDGKLKITTTIGMITDVTKNVGGEHVEVTGLMKTGVDPHLYKASQGDMKKLDEAELILYNGLHLEGKMGEIFEKMEKQKPVIAVTRDIKEEELRTAGDGIHDPHVWFNVRHWITATETIRDVLIEQDPKNADEYKQNAQEYIAKLEELDTYVRGQIATIPKERRVLVTAHDAFGYFGDAYDIEVMGLQGLSTASEYGSKDVSKLRDYLVEKKIKAVFVESSVPKKAIEAVVEGAKKKGHEVKIGGELFSDAMGEEGTEEGTYIGMVRHNVDTIVNALK
ncbi:metal ABC transporter solute-binding protein, Zn/Mn family [Bacillus songklensis]|uniref:Metal ABC transporter solute-binding protein, Zn/Mn family n=1 Tax=Bacillus songklensis TaxID=1069116 RepID=A0ABV8B047_9BACI